MKCPKCGYLGFERVDRCRNCHYDFSLTSPIPEPDLTIRRDTQTAKPLEDLPLADASAVVVEEVVLVAVPPGAAVALTGSA